MAKAKTAITFFRSSPKLKRKPFWGHNFWSQGYYVSTVGIDEEKNSKYVKHQEEKEP